MILAIVFIVGFVCLLACQQMQISVISKALALHASQSTKISSASQQLPTQQETTAPTPASQDKLDEFILWYDLTSSPPNDRMWTLDSAYSTSSLPGVTLYFALPKNARPADVVYYNNNAFGYDVSPSSNRTAEFGLSILPQTAKFAADYKICQSGGRDRTNGEPPLKMLKINGTNFCEKSYEDCGAGTCGATNQFFAPLNGMIIVFETETHGSTCAAYDNPEECPRFNDKILSAIIDSLQIRKQ